MKRFVSAILAIVMTLLLFCSVYADNSPELAEQSAAVDSAENIQLSSEDIADVVSPENIESDASGKDDENVAILYLCAAGPRGRYIWGHAWIMIKNISDEDIVIGENIIPPGTMISAGLHHDGGLKYNRELETFNGCTVSAKEKYMNAKELEICKKEMFSSRWSWYEYFAHNCTNFATSVWLAVTGNFYICFCFPFVVQLQLAASGAKGVGVAQANVADASK